MLSFGAEKAETSFGAYDQSSMIHEAAVKSALVGLPSLSDADEDELAADDSFLPLMSDDYSINAGDVSLESFINMKAELQRVENKVLSTRTGRLDSLIRLVNQKSEEIIQQARVTMEAFKKEESKVDDSVDFASKKRRERISLIKQRIAREKAEAERIEQERLEEINRQQQERERLRIEAEKKKAEELRIAEEARLAAEREQKQKLEQQAREEMARKKLQEEKEEQERQAKLKAEQEKKKLEEEKKKAEAEKQQQAAAKAKALEEAHRAKTIYTNWSAVEDEFNFYHDIIREMKDLAPIVSQDKPLKNYCFNHKTAIRPKLGQITTSNKHVLQIADEISQIFAQIKSERPEAYKFVVNSFAKLAVKQAEVEVVANVQQAIPLGKMMAIVMARNLEACDIIMARFVKRAPQVIGYTCRIDTDDGRKKMAWKKSDTWEQESKYVERISAITQVWSVITITSVEPQRLSHPYPISHSWIFLARHCNKTATSADFHVVAAWWEIACRDFAKAYGKQATKLLKLICEEWAQNKTNGAAQRLTIMGEDWLKSGQLTVGWDPLAA